MFELLIILIICVGLCRKRGERWEWSRTRLRRTFAGLVGEGERAALRARRSLPDLYRQCLADVRSLVSDALDLLQPDARRRLERGARSLAERVGRPPRRTLGAVPAGGALAAGSGPGGAVGPAPERAPAYERLQRRYLDGSISLTDYVREAGRLRSGEEPS